MEYWARNEGTRLPHHIVFYVKLVSRNALTIETSPVETIQVDSSDVYRLMVFREAFKEEFKLLSLVWKYGLEMDPYILTRLANGGKQFLRIVSTLKESIVTPWIRSIFTALEVSLKKFVRYLRIVKYFGHWR